LAFSKTSSFSPYFTTLFAVGFADFHQLSKGLTSKPSEIGRISFAFHFLKREMIIWFGNLEKIEDQPKLARLNSVGGFKDKFPYKKFKIEQTFPLTVFVFLPQFKS
jgi:hypothetical protein